MSDYFELVLTHPHLPTISLPLLKVLWYDAFSLQRGIRNLLGAPMVGPLTREGAVYPTI